MRKFRLNKVYPGSPNLYTILRENNHDPCLFVESGMENLICPKGISLNIIKGYPEYWQEIKEEYPHCTNCGKEIRDLCKDCGYILFITEDRKPIFEGDEYYSLYKDLRTCLIRLFKADSKSGKSGDLVLYFSTKEKALEHIIENKPILSIKDLQDSWQFRYQDGKYVHESNTLRKLRDLVKSKLKL